MKPDQFADQIRQKLESIEPTFREKDWVQLQHTMRVHGGGIYQPGLPHWVMPTAGSLVLASLATVVYFQYAANEKLKNEVRSLNQTVTQLQQQPRVVEQPPDTVYVTRYIESQSGHSPTWEGELSNASIDRSLREMRGREQLADARQPQQEVITDEAGNETVSNRSLNPSVNETNATSSSLRRNGSTETGAVGLSRSNQSASINAAVGVGNNRLRPGYIPEKETYASPGTNRAGWDSRGNYAVNSQPNAFRTTNRAATGVNQPYNSYEPNVGRSGSGMGNNSSVNDYSTYNRQKGTGRSGAGYGSASAAESSASEAVSWALPGIDEITPLTIVTDTAYYHEGMVKISRRIRRLLPAMAAQSQVATTPTAGNPVTDWRFRGGIGGYVGSQQYGGGLFAEVRVGSNWIFGLGLLDSRISGGTYLTDYMYTERTKRDFRKEYAGGIDPRFDILNITRKATTWQVPISVGYRIALQKNWSIVPTAGFSMNISNQEKIAFNYLRPPNPIVGGPNALEERYLLIEYQKKYMHTVLSSVGIEKTWQRISVQAGPYVSLPLNTDIKTLNTSSGGVRARVFYRF